MSSLFADQQDPQEMPGFHYARIMAAALLLDPEKAKQIQDSARFLIGAIPARPESVGELHSLAQQLAMLLVANPELANGYPGEAYWPLRVILDEMTEAGINYTLAGLEQRS